MESVRAELAEARALGFSSRPGDAVSMAKAAAAVAVDIGYRPLEAEARDVEGDLLHRTGAYKEAVATLEQAVIAAEAGHDESKETKAWVDLTRADVGLHRNAEARLAAQHAHACLEREVPDDDRLATLLLAEGEIAVNEEHFEQAIDVVTRALAIRERLSPNSLDVAACLGKLGDATLRLGRHDDALAYARRSLAIREKALGPAHPLVASAVNNVGNALLYKEDFEGAIAAYRRALDIRIAAFGPDAPAVADALSNLGLALSLGGKYQAAIDTEQRALAIRLRVFGHDHTLVASCYLNLADAQLRLHRWDDAIASATLALDIQQKVPGAAESRLAAPLTQIGQGLLGRGEAARALPVLERAMRLAEAQEGEAGKVAETRESLALALVATHGDLPRARKLAAQVRETYVALGPDAKQDLVRLDVEFPPR
jgi:serine/threonine-protein kinase